MESTLAPILEVAPARPEPEVVNRAAAALAKGGVVAFPTDTLYGFGCLLGQSDAVGRIHKMRNLDPQKRPLTLLLPDLGLVPRYATVHHSGYKILQRIFPGPYCAELLATEAVPGPFVHGERRTIGIRIPASSFCQKLMWKLGHPLLSATAKDPRGRILTTADDIQETYGHELDLILDGGPLVGPPSTVVSLAGGWISVLREGRGPSGKVSPL